MSQTTVVKAEQILYPGWLMVSQIRNGQTAPEGDALYRRACQLVPQMRRQFEEAGFSESSREQMLFALCALLDESVLRRGDGGDVYQCWHTNPLQVHLFSRHDAGKAIWEDIRTLLKSPAPDMAVMSCLYRTLQLGFVGQYREQGHERREDVVRALAERVPPFTLSQESPVVVRPSVLRGGRWWYWLSWGAGTAALAAMWFVFSTLLDGQVAQLLGSG
ncbi:type VI secretion system protein TssL, short form [Serratia marcescens]|uniref:type VI secretion system protein TssL, short form n=1 Tax=Serratia marcescens TaxID=615 RepID=UPI001EEF879A|nr:type VI secretion system protein TssL, short form [Serratia marcescens]ULH11522.1 type VI secretion system protein TssL, short form [Serratia marcescens]